VYLSKMPTTEQPIPSSSSLYRPLSDSRCEIRVLTLSKDKLGLLSCTLEHSSLFNPGEYTALSYCWGDPYTTVPITVNSTRKYVTENLWDALERLSYMNITRLWVDALCINQGDHEERSRQVRLMKLIYSRATEVISWIGKSSDDSSQAMAALNKRSKSGSSSADNTNWEKLENLFARPYWKRIWIIQEVAVASKVRILCGKDEITWDELGVADELYGSTVLQTSLDATNYSYIRNVSSFRKRIRATERFGLFEAIFTSQNALSTDPRDKIFALLGLCHDGPDLVPLPNYDQPIGELLRDLTRQLMLMNQSLDFITASNPNSQVESYTLPSWTPNWLGPWSPHAIRTLDSLSKAQDGFFLADRETHPSVLRVRGLVISTVRLITRLPNRINPTGIYPENPPEPDIYYDKPSKIIDALCESLFHQDYIPPLDTAEAKSQWLKATGKFLRTLQSNEGRLQLGRYIHTIHTSDHVRCGKRESPWIPKEQAWGQHLCYDLNHTMDYELKVFEELMTWLDEVWKLQINGKPLGVWVQKDSAESHRGTQLTVSDRRHRAIQRATLDLEHTRLTRSMLFAARNNRRFVILQSGQLEIANAETLVGDLICNLQGCSKPVVLREFKAIEGTNVRVGYHVLGDAYTLFPGAGVLSNGINSQIIRNFDIH
jgi:hypothetical protein